MCGLSLGGNTAGLNTTSAHIHQDLIEACKSGDRLAQFRLYKLYSRAMYNICTRILGDTDAANDAMQEAFISAFKKLDSFEGRASFGAWLKRIVVNRCLSHLKGKQLFEEPISERMEETLADEAIPGPAGEISSERIHAAIKSLPKGCRVVFSLYQLEGYDHQEISEIMSISVSTSKSQYHRAKKLLQDRLSGARQLGKTG